MGSQFVDLNADGHLDYVSATFDGSPHVAYGSAEGFGKPVRLKDANGERILITYYWDYEKKKHLTTSRAMPSDKASNQRCISALAFDWDGDGDYDLLLGGYEEGRLYRQMNEGTNAEPKFTGKNIAVMAGGKPFALAAKMTTPRLVDWDGDGDMDLIAGSFGDSYSQRGKGGGVYLSRNTGSKGKPSFGALETLIPPSPKGAHAPTRPDAGLYADAVDYDGDGDLDLVVGGYSMWTPKPRELTEKEQAMVTRLQEKQRKLQAEQSKLMRKVSKEASAAIRGMEPKSVEARKKRSAVFAAHRKETSAIGKKVMAVRKQVEEYLPGPKRKSFVWLYERQ